MPLFESRFIAFLSCFVPQILSAETFAEDCLVIENDLDRLACYDTLSGRTAKSTTAYGKGKWHVQSEVSDFKDTKDVYLTLTSEDSVQCGFGSGGTLTLMLRCKENTTSLLIITPCHVASGFYGYGMVEYRIDNHTAQKKQFDESTDNTTLGLWSGGKSIPVIKSLFGADRLLVRFTPFNESPVTGEFVVSGVEEAITPLRESCHW